MVIYFFSSESFEFGFVLNFAGLRPAGLISGDVSQ